MTEPTYKQVHNEKVQVRLEEILENPDGHYHTDTELSRCCTIDGEVVSELVEAHGGTATIQDDDALWDENTDTSEIDLSWQ